MTKEDFHRQHDEAYEQRKAIWAEYATATWDRIADLGVAHRALTAKMTKLERDYHAALTAQSGIKA